MESSPHSPNIKTDSRLDYAQDTPNWLSPSSLLFTDGGDNPFHQAFSDRAGSNTSQQDSNPPASSDVHSHTSEARTGGQFIQEALNNIKAARSAQSQHQRIESEAAERRQVTRMQQFLDSGDPILVAEAMAWARVSSGVL